MTEPRSENHDDGMDDERDLDRLRSLGLDRLGDDLTDVGWADVRRRSRRHLRRRRLPMVAAAAALIVVVAGAVALLRAGGGVETDERPLAGGGGSVMLLPPEDATDVGWQLGLDAVYGPDTDPLEWPDLAERVRFYLLSYTTADGTTVRMTVGDAGETPSTVQGAPGVDAVGVCDTRRADSPEGPYSCWWSAGRSAVVIERVNSGLRVVDVATWQEFLRATRDTNAAISDQWTDALPEGSGDTSGDLDAFCARVAAGADVPESYIGTPEHVAAVEQLMAVAPTEVRPYIAVYLDYLRSGAVDPAVPDSNLIDGWPAAVRSAVAELSAYSSRECGVDTPG